MRARRLRPSVLATLLASVGLSALLILVAGCGNKETTSTSASVPPPPTARAATAVPDAGLPPLALKVVEYGENDFVESDRNRDPFRNFASAFAEQNRRPVTNQRAVLLSQFAIEELKLVAIVTGGDYPRAMFVDPGGKGWVIKRGDFIGRPDVVHTGGTNGADYQLNWRVDRVRDGDVVLTREDPANPGVPPATRVIPIRQEKDETAAR